MPFVTITLLVLTIAVYVLGNPLSLALRPIPSELFHPYQLLTYALLHGGPLHLAVNMVALLSFGPALEKEWGHWRCLACYALAAAFGGCTQALVTHQPVVGASAALVGLFAAYVINKPKARIMTLFPWPSPAWFVLVAYAGLSRAAYLLDWMLGLAHVAHLGGMMVGVSFAKTKNNKPPV